MNVERLRKVMDAIAAQPQALNMGLWHCDTHACFAGHAVDLMAKEQGVSVTMLYRPGQGRISYACCVGDGPQQHWSDAAREYLDLSEDEGDALFDPGCWPPSFERAYDDADDLDDANGMVAALRARVEHFIAHGE